LKKKIFALRNQEEEERGKGGRHPGGRSSVYKDCDIS